MFLRSLIPAGIAVLLSCSCSPRNYNGPSSTQGHGEMQDPYLWLEEATSERSLAFVKEQNRRTDDFILKDSRFQTVLKAAKEVVMARDRLPAVQMIAGQVYDFWQDATHEKGLWRRSSPEAFDGNRGNPPWETVLDLDALANAESRNWTWKGVTCTPSGSRCLVSLSSGEHDKVVQREFDTTNRRFVTDGFVVPEGKTFSLYGSVAAWLDENTLLVGLTGSEERELASGLPRQVVLWKRGTPLDAAPVIFSGERSDFAVVSETHPSAEGNLTVIHRSMDFLNGEYHIVAQDGTLSRLELPPQARLTGYYHGRIVVLLGSDATIAGKEFQAGSVVAIPLARRNMPELVFPPTPKGSVDGVTHLRSGIAISLTENVASRVISMSEREGTWTATPYPVDSGVSGQVLASDPLQDRFYYLVQGFLLPPSLQLFAFQNGAPAVVTIRQMQAQFDASPFTVEQNWAKSADGTKVPYFIVHRKDWKASGANPTHILAYGGFRVSLLPNYSGKIGRLWLEKGGVFVLANIRGGGEFGPAWHDAARLERRQRAFDDLIAVSEDLMARKVTSPRHLAIEGASNGGLLVGAVMVQRPDLFKAVICGHPVLDMLRYNKFGNASIGESEYGLPDDGSPAARAMRAYSPYQNVRSGVKMPTVLFSTSTNDGNAHPGHARKMAARMQEQGHEAFLYENSDGGHSGAANAEEAAVLGALYYTFLIKELMP